MGAKRKEANVVAVSVAEVAPGLNWRYVEVSNPKAAVQALEMLAEGVSHERTMKETGLGWEALVALKTRHKMALDERRAQLANDSFDMAERARALIVKKTNRLFNDTEALDKTSLKDLSLSYAIAVDKGMQALGEATQIVEVKQGKPSIEDAMKAIQEAKAALKATSVEVAVSEVKDE